MTFDYAVKGQMSIQETVTAYVLTVHAIAAA